MPSAAVTAATTPLLLHQFHWAEVDKWQPLVNIPEPPVGWLLLLLLTDARCWCHQLVFLATHAFESVFCVNCFCSSTFNAEGNQKEFGGVR